MAVGTERRTLEVAVKAKDEATPALTGIGNALSKVGESAKRALGEVVKGALRGVGEQLAQLPGKFIAFGKELLDEADAAQKLAAALGTTTESLTALEFAAKQSGIEQGELATSSRALLKAIESAREGSSEQSEAFAMLGVNVRALSGDQLDLVEIFSQVADGVNSISDPVERANVLLKVFGKSGNDLANLFAEGSAGIRAMAKDAKALGVVLDQDLIKKADAAGDEINRLSSVIKGSFFDIIRENLPEFTRGVKTLTEFIRENKKPIVTLFSDIGVSVLNALGAVTKGVLLLTGTINTAIAGWQRAFAIAKVEFLKLRNSIAGGNDESFIQARAEQMLGQPGFPRSGDASRDRFMAQLAAQQEAQRNSPAAARQKELQDAIREQELTFGRTEGKDPTALAAQYDKLIEKLKQTAMATRDTTSAQMENRQEAARQSAQQSEFLKGVGEGYRRFYQQVNDTASLGRNAAYEGLAGMRDITAQTIYSLTTGAMNFREAMRSVATSILQLIARVSAELAAARLAGIFTSLAGGGGAAATTSPGAGGGGIYGGGGGIGGGGLAAFGAGAGAGGGGTGARLKSLSRDMQLAARRFKTLRDAYGLR